MSTPLFMLRLLEVGISLRDADLLTMGMVLDLCTEKGNDACTYNYVATQDDYDSF